VPLRGPLPQRRSPTNAGGYVRERRDAMAPSCPPARMASPPNLDTRPDLSKPDIGRISHGSPAASVSCPLPNLDTPRRTVSTVGLQFPGRLAVRSKSGTSVGGREHSPPLIIQGGNRGSAGRSPLFLQRETAARADGHGLHQQGISRDLATLRMAGSYRGIAAAKRVQIGPAAGCSAATTISADARLVPAGGARARSHPARRGSSPDLGATAEGAGPDQPGHRAPAIGLPGRRAGRHRGAGESGTCSRLPAVVRRSLHRASIRRPP